MLRAIRNLNHLKIHASDGEIGQVEDCYIDDSHWAVRYLVVRAGSWLTGRLVLISPISVRSVDWGHHEVWVNLTQEQIRLSPDIDVDKPVSRQKEVQYFAYYHWPNYWTGAGIWGIGPYPSALGRTYPMGLPSTSYLEANGIHPEIGELKEEPEEAHGDPHLRSMRELIGYRISAEDRVFGHIENFILDEDTWSIRYLVVDTKNWWPSKSVLLSPEWINAVSWLDRHVKVDLPAQKIKDSPEYRLHQPIDRNFEEKLFNYYGRKKYWEDVRQHPGRYVV